MTPEARKQQRLQRRKQRQARRKKRLLIAGAVAVAALVILLIILLSGGSKQSSPPATSVPVGTSPDGTAPSASAEDTTQPTVIHFVATGDLNVTDRLMQSNLTTEDFSTVIMDVAHLLADADLTTVNLEGNLCGVPYGASASAPQHLVQALDKAGVDMIQLSNSYAIHRGISGLMSTIDGVQQAGMEPIGVFRDSAEYARKNGFTLFEIQGVRVAVVGFTKGMDGTTLPPGNEQCVNILYSDYDSVYQKVNTDKITSVLRAAEAAQPDITIALLHWGSEFNDSISSSQKRIIDLMRQNGVDAIIGTHPHYVQQITFDRENGFLVAYSLGDFISDAARAGSEYSILLDLEITKDHANGTTSITGYDYTPLFSVVEEGKPTRIVRIQEALSAYTAGHTGAVLKETYDDMLYALTRIEARVNGEG